jgi:hypothetical protein
MFRDVETGPIAVDVFVCKIFWRIEVSCGNIWNEMGVQRGGEIGEIFTEPSAFGISAGDTVEWTLVCVEIRSRDSCGSVEGGGRRECGLVGWSEEVGLGGFE